MSKAIQKLARVRRWIASLKGKHFVFPFALAMTRQAEFEDARKAMQQGDWDKFGKVMQALKTLLLASPPS